MCESLAVAMASCGTTAPEEAVNIGALVESILDDINENM
jgi:hypothetical protein